MKKILNLFIFLGLMLVLFGCGSKKNSTTAKKTNTYVFKNVYEIEDSSFDKQVEITDIKLKGIPEAPIEIGYFSFAGIALEVNYIDGTTKIITVTEKLFPESSLKEFTTPGKKYFDLVYKQKHMALRFELVEPTTAVKYKVTFHQRTGEEIYTTYVSYLDSVTFTRTDEIKDYTDGNYIYKFNNKWSEDTSHIYYNVDLYPQFDKKDYINANEGYKFESGYNLVNDYKTANDQFKGLVYVGRMKNVVLASLNVEEVFVNDNQTISFYKNAYSSNDKLLSTMLQSVKQTILVENYIHDGSSCWTNLYIKNSSKLRFDPSKNESRAAYNGIGLGYTNITVPSCIQTSLSDYSSYTGFTRGDGVRISNLSMLDLTSDDVYNNYYLNGEDTVTINVTPDYKTGYYRLDFVADLDIFLDLTYTISSVDDGRCFDLKEAKIAFTYTEEQPAFKLRYSSDGNFDKVGMPITVSDRDVVLALNRTKQND